MKKLITFTIPNTPMPSPLAIGGEANGYVAIPPSHPLHCVGYDEINSKLPIGVHGGLTFSNFADNNDVLAGYAEKHNIPANYWIVGFDTMHFGDNKENWSLENVEQELKSLVKQMNDIK